MLIRKQQSETEENASRVLVCSEPNEAISGVTPEQCGARPLTSVITQTSARVGNVWQCLVSHRQVSGADVSHPIIGVAANKNSQEQQIDPIALSVC